MNASAVSTYPESSADRDLWITGQRGPREPVDPGRPYAFLVEEEHFSSGEVGPVATIFLTNRECPWRCAMCDLWRHTVTHTVPAGAIPKQIDYALSRLPVARQIKLYNSGSFFDPLAIPPQDYSAIAAQLRSFERVIVESHPSLINERCLEFQKALRAQAPHARLEVAMGLETAHPTVLQKLNKKMTLAQYASAAQRLQGNAIDLRCFILVQPPFMAESESLTWACRSIDFAIDCGATAISLLPTRGGNGAMETLAVAGAFAPPHIQLVEKAQIYGLTRHTSRIFVDLWDIARVPSCEACRTARVTLLAQRNLSQEPLQPLDCRTCGAAA